MCGCSAGGRQQGCRCDAGGVACRVRADWAIVPERGMKLPAHDVLPFENLSPHPRCRSSVRLRCGRLPRVRLDCDCPVEAAAAKLFAAPFYGGLAQILRRGRRSRCGDTDLASSERWLYADGYRRDAGAVTRRGGILRCVFAQADRPVRFEFFGDEIETIKKFDPRRSGLRLVS